MDQSFKRGFEKVAYDYEWEVQQQEEDAAFRSMQTPVKPSKMMGVPAAIGATIGALGSVKGRKLKGAATLGSIGLGLGALGSMINHHVISDAKKIMAMPEDKRKAYLKARARGSEQLSDFLDQERRHYDLKNTIKGS